MDIDISERTGYVSSEVSNLILIIKQGEAFLDVYVNKLLKEGVSKIDILAYLCEAKTYFNLDLKKELPTINDRAFVYYRYARYASTVGDTIQMIDNKIKDLQSN